jgi:hypothetical protein
MIKVKKSIFIEIKIFFQTLSHKKWLDDNEYIYFLCGSSNPRPLDVSKIIQYLNKQATTNDKIKQLLKSGVKYTVYLIRFGTYGSYDLPGTIYLNLRRKTPDEILDTLIHELIHLKVEQYVIDNDLSHKEKEELVDNLFSKLK